MRYMGSKRLIARHILPIILKERKEGQLYIEPFVGGANSFALVECPKLGLDINPATIQALKLIRDNPTSLPKTADEITREVYKQIKEDKTHPWHGYVGFACSFGGRYFEGIAAKTTTDHVASQYKASQNLSKGLQGAELSWASYYTCVYLGIPPSIIYCDPPYDGVKGYKYSFNHSQFWQWCRDAHKQGHKVFISELKAPEDFVCIWEKEHRNTIGGNTKSQKEKLFTLL